MSLGGDHLRITQVGVQDVVMPKSDPKWRFALGARPESLGVIVRIGIDNDLVGFGFVSEIPHLGYPITFVRSVLNSVVEALQGCSIVEYQPLLSDIWKKMDGCRPAFAAVEMAILDVLAKAQGLPLYKFLGGAFRHQVDVLRILALKSPHEVAQNAVQLANQGYRYLKIKIDNNDLDLDVARIKAVREAVGEHIHLTLDANQSYSPKEAVLLYERVHQCNIDLFEQPVPAYDFSGLKFVRNHVQCLVEADESAACLEDVFRLLHMEAVDVISMKILKLGGIQSLLKVSNLCNAAGVRCRVGAHVGSRLLNAAAMHCVAAIPNIDYACEVGEFSRLLGDPFTGLEVTNGTLRVPETVGIGVSFTEVKSH